MLARPQAILAITNLAIPQRLLEQLFEVCFDCMESAGMCFQGSAPVPINANTQTCTMQRWLFHAHDLELDQYLNSMLAGNTNQRRTPGISFCDSSIYGFLV